VAQDLRQIVSRMVEAGESEEDIAAVIQRLSAAPAAPEAPRESAPSRWTMDPDTTLGFGVDPSKRPQQPFGEQLPMMGGMAGAAMGGPGGAMVGGAAGALGRDLLRANRGDARTPSTAGDAAMNVGQEGAIQGALTGAAQMAGSAAPKLARRMYAGLLKVPKALKDSFGGDEIVDTLVRGRVPLTRRGAETATGRMSESRNTAMQMVRDAEAAGASRVMPREMAREFRPVVSTLRRRADIGQPDAAPAAAARARTISRRNPGGVQLTRAQELKETAQDSARGAYRQMAQGGKGQLSADDLLDEATARGLRTAIESRVPGVAGQNQTTQRWMGASDALENALQREGNTLGVGGMRDLISTGVGAGGGAVAGGPGGAVVGAALMRLLSTPGAGSQAAITLDRIAPAISHGDQAVRLLDMLMRQRSSQ